MGVNKQINQFICNNERMQGIGQRCQKEGSK